MGPLIMVSLAYYKERQMLNGKCQLLRQPVESIVIPRVGKSAVMSHIEQVQYFFWMQTVCLFRP